jgi:hypothetical protein
VNSNILSEILSFIQTLKANHVEVTGPTQNGDSLVFRVNEHTLTEDEIRFLGRENRLTNWEIYEYVKRRDERQGFNRRRDRNPLDL